MNLIPTSHGLVGFTPPSREAAVVVIRGLSAHNQLRELPAAFLDLPGFIAPTFESYRVEAIAEAFDEALALALPGRSVRLVGVSTGAIVALRMRSPQIAEILAVEPFLDSAAAWPLAQWSTGLTGELSRFCAEFFRLPGHGRLFSATPVAPLDVLCGDVPLGHPRALPAWPSLCGEADEAILRRVARSFTRVPGGHDLPKENLAAIREALRGLDRPVSREGVDGVAAR